MATKTKKIAHVTGTLIFAKDHLEIVVFQGSIDEMKFTLRPPVKTGKLGEFLSKTTPFINQKIKVEGQVEETSPRNGILYADEKHITPTAPDHFKPNDGDEYRVLPN